MTPGARQSAGSGDTAFRYPWSTDPRADAKTDLFEYVAGTPDGANIPYIVRTVFGRDTDLAGADTRLARRFFADYPEIFETARRDGFVWVSPTPAALTLSRRKHRAKNTDGDGVGGYAPETRDEWAKDRARSFISKWSTVGSDSTRADLLGELATELRSIDDVWQVYERTRGDGPDYLCLPYRTRFNAPDRVADTRETFDRAWRRATDRYDRAVAVTLTTDPKRHDSIGDAVDDLFRNKNRLMAWLDYDPTSPDAPPRPGERLPNLTVFEWSDKGLPHLHIVFFGVRFVTPKRTLTWKWSDYGQGEVVWFDGLANRDGSWRWSGDAPDDANGQTPRAYLSKSLRSLSMVAGMSPDDVDDAASARRSGEPVDAPDDLWKLALYWATGRRTFYGSPSLLHDDLGGDDADRVPHIPRYRFVGVARYDDIPGYIRNRGRFLTSTHGDRVDQGRPPP